MPHLRGEFSKNKKARRLLAGQKIGEIVFMSFLRWRIKNQ
jgi:hypothetical protein